MPKARQNYLKTSVLIYALFIECPIPKPIPFSNLLKLFIGAKQNSNMRMTVVKIKVLGIRLTFIDVLISS